MLDALTLAEACLRGDHEALAVILDTGDSRAQARVLSEALASYLRGTLGDRALGEVARIRPVLLGGRAGELTARRAICPDMANLGTGRPGRVIEAAGSPGHPRAVSRSRAVAAGLSPAPSVGAPLPLPVFAPALVCRVRESRPIGRLAARMMVCHGSI